MQTTQSRASLMGEAPRIALIVFPVLGAAVALTALFPSTFRFTGRYWGVGVAAGIELAAVGIAFWAVAAFSLVRAWRAGKMASRGAYGISRHPIFAWWIWSVLPALAFMLDSWLFLACAVFFYVASRGAARKEDDGLWERFGREFAVYEVRVRFSLPVPRLFPLRFRRYLKAAGVLAMIGVLMLGVYVSVVRPVLFRLGASRAEAAAVMPGDMLVAAPGVFYTQALDIKAPAAEVWKWLVQVGYHRAGWYNVDAINRLAAPDYFIDGKGSSTVIHPELLGIAPGDKIYLVPALGMTVVTADAPRLLVMAGDPTHPDAATNLAWTYLVEPRGDAACRLIVRYAASYPRDFLSVVLNEVFNGMGSAMLQQPAMLRGIQWRAEKAS